MTDPAINPLSDAMAARRREERRPVDEAGGGESEGFEQAEALLVEHASHADQHTTSQIGQHSSRVNEDASSLDASTYGEADSERHT